MMFSKIGAYAVATWIAAFVLSAAYAFATNNGFAALGAGMVLAWAGIAMLPMAGIMATVALIRKEEKPGLSVAVLLTSVLASVLIATVGRSFLSGDFGLYR